MYKKSVLNTEIKQKSVCGFYFMPGQTPERKQIKQTSKPIMMLDLGASRHLSASRFS